MKRFALCIPILAVVIIGLSLLFATRASALSPSDFNLYYDTFTGGSCDVNSFSVNAVSHWTALVDMTIIGTTTLNGALYNGYSLTKAAGANQSSSSLFSRTFSSPLASVNYVFVYRSVVVINGVSYGAAITTITCSGSGLSATSVWVPGTAIIPGPQIPLAFVLRTINCTIAVFDSAGGNPVSTGEKITQGQTWFVSPNPVKVKDRSWTEVFVGGYSNGFIWTSCVGDKPADFTGP